MTVFPPDSWAARFGILIVVGAIWWRVSTWLGISPFTSAVLAGAAVLIAARWMAVHWLD